MTLNESFNLRESTRVSASVLTCKAGGQKREGAVGQPRELISFQGGSRSSLDKEPSSGTAGVVIREHSRRGFQIAGHDPLG